MVAMKHTHVAESELAVGPYCGLIRGSRIGRHPVVAARIHEPGRGRSDCIWPKAAAPNLGVEDQVDPRGMTLLPF